MGRRRVVRDERGVVLIVALIVVLILAGIALAIAQTTTAELEIHRMSRWDDVARYLAHAGVEHQIYLLKGNQSAAAVPYQNYPVLSGETAGCGTLWYITTLQCTLNCTGSNQTIRDWTITASGEVRNSPDCVAWTRLLQRQIQAKVEITYQSVGGVMIPQTVTFQRWAEISP